MQSCGRETMVVLLGVLESIWSAHSEQSAVGGRLAKAAPRKAYVTQRSQEHEKLIAFIDDGDADAAVALAREHLARSTYYVTGGSEATRVIDAALLGRYIDRARQS